MRKRSKRYTELKNKKEDAGYGITQAIEKVKGMSTAKFDESVELSISLGIDPAKSDQMVRGNVSLPHGTGKDVRVAGEVANGTIEWEDDDVVLHFTLVENEERLDVVYHGIFSDALQGGQDVVVEGKYSDGILMASTIMTKCPTKYEPRE